MLGELEKEAIGKEVSEQAGWSSASGSGRDGSLSLTEQQDLRSIGTRRRKSTEEVEEEHHDDLFTSAAMERGGIVREDQPDVNNGTRPGVSQ